MSKPNALEEMMRHWASLMPDPNVPRPAQIKAGQSAWPKLKAQLAAPTERNGVQLTHPLGALLGIPVHVLAPESWPPNLVTVLDQKGNVMSAWIIND